jgi:hypothetical protein
MRTVRLLVLTVAIATGMSQTANASLTLSGDSAHDVVAGSGLTRTQPGSGGEVTVGAQSGPNGENPVGTITVEDPFPKPPEQDTYRVVCVSVAGNLAEVVGISNDRATPTKGIIVNITDQGTPSLVPDELSVLVLPQLPSTSCAAAPGAEPLTHGNFVVEDR